MDSNSELGAWISELNLDLETIPHPLLRWESFILPEDNAEYLPSFEGGGGGG